MLEWVGGKMLIILHVQKDSIWVDLIHGLGHWIIVVYVVLVNFGTILFLGFGSGPIVVYVFRFGDWADD